MPLFTCYAIFNPEKTSLLTERRQKHLDYLKQGNCIHYGGVITDMDQAYKGILMIVKADNMEEAIAFFSNDPYFELYEHYAIDYFTQRIPVL